LRDSPMSSLYANADILDRNTNTFDRILATLFYVLFVFSGLTMILMVLFEAFGVFE